MRGNGNWAWRERSGARRNAQDLLDLSQRRIKTRCCLPRGQFSTRKPIKSVDSPKRFWVQRFLLPDRPPPLLPFCPYLPRHRPPWPLIRLSRFLFRELKSDILSRDTIQHASRLMSSRPTRERGFRTLERTGQDNCLYFREIDRRPGKKERSPRRIRRKALCSLSRAERRSGEKKKKKSENEKSGEREKKRKACDLNRDFAIHARISVNRAGALPSG